MSMSFVIDSQQIVHLGICREVTEPALPYKTKSLGVEEMREWLLHPDTRDGHSGPPVIAPCLTCLGGN